MEQTVSLSKLATQTCFFPLYECTIDDGRPLYKLSGPSAGIAKRPASKKPVEDYLKSQGRFRHLFRPEKRDDLINSIQVWVDHKWEILLEKAGV